MQRKSLILAGLALLAALFSAWLWLRPDPLEQAAAAFGLPEGSTTTAPAEHFEADGTFLRQYHRSFETGLGPDALMTWARARCAALGAPPAAHQLLPSAEPLCTLPGPPAAAISLGGRCGETGCTATLVFMRL